MKSNQPIVYRCTCGASVIVKVAGADVWCLPCGRRMRPIRASDNTASQQARPATKGTP